MKLSTKLVAIVAAIAAIAAPLGASATHCEPGIIIFSGVDSGQNDPDGVPFRPGPNGSLAGCLVDPSDESLALIWPGATNMVVAYTVSTPVAPTGTLTFNGQTTPLTFTRLKPVYATSARWESQSIPTQVGAGPVTATVFVGSEEVGSVTYQKYA